MTALNPIDDGPISENVFLKNAFAALRRDCAVPNAFGINEQPRSVDADAETTGLGPHDRKIQLRAATLEIIPGEFG